MQYPLLEYSLTIIDVSLHKSYVADRHIMKFIVLSNKYIVHNIGYY